MSLTSEEVTLLAVIATPMAIVVIVGFLRGYNFHLTKNRITEHKKDKDE